MQHEKLTLVLPQWQGGGQDLRTRTGAFTLRDSYLQTKDAVTVDTGAEELSPQREDILGYEDILRAMDEIGGLLTVRDPARIFTLGGGCDADAPCAAWLNRKYGGEMAVVYIDAHGDLNTPAASLTKLYYGMSLRALLGDGAPGIVSRLVSAVRPKQLICCANRALDPEEIRYKAEQKITDLSVETLEKDPASVARAVLGSGYRHVYIHLDLDSLDPQEGPPVPLPEPDGLRRETLLAMLRALQESSAEIVGFGIFEYAGTAKDKEDSLIRSLVSFGEAI